MKRYDVEIETVQTTEVQVWAENWEDARLRAERMEIDDVLREGSRNDFEKRVIGVRRNVESRMYRA